MRRGYVTSCQIETLEPRCLLAADVTVAFRHLPDTFLAGRHQTYELRIANQGDENAADIRIVHETDLENLRWQTLREDVQPHGIAVRGLTSDKPVAAIGIGDFNRDGREDFAIGDWPAGNAGEVYVIFGTDNFARIDVNRLDGENGFVVVGGNLLESMGSSLATADVNGDDIADLLIGSRSGDSRVIFGGGEYEPRVEVSGEVGFKVFSACCPLGIRVASAGDFNDDGIEDFTISDRNTIHLVYGRDDLGSDFSVTEINQVGGLSFTHDGSRSTVFAAVLGDVNGDSVDDIAIGHYGYTYVLFGGADRPQPNVILGDQQVAHGVVFRTTEEIYEPKPVGDFNGDGANDFVLVGRETTQLVFGGPGLNNQSAPIELNDALARQILRHDSQDNVSVVARDINSDGLSDLVIGHAELEGAVVDVVFGSRDPSADLRLHRAFTDTDNTTMNLHGLGDIDGDGREELWIDALGHSRQTQIVHWPAEPDPMDRSGRSGTDTLDVSMDLPAGSQIVFRVGAETPITHPGEIVSTVSAMLADPAKDADLANNRRSHRAEIRSQQDLNVKVKPPDAPVLPGEETTYAFSVTNDGTAASQIAIYDPVSSLLEDVTWTRTIQAFSTDHFLGKVIDPDPGSFYFRKWLKDGITLDGKNGYVLEGRQPVPLNTDESSRLEEHGRSVSASGDLNGDGLDDVAVGASGEVFVKFGSPAEQLGRLRPETLTAASGFLITGFDNDYWAVKVEVVGDVNSDGIDDLLIAAPPREADGHYEVYVVYGSKELGGQPLDVKDLHGKRGFRITGVRSPAPSFRPDRLRLEGGDINGDGAMDLVMASPTQIVSVFGGQVIGDRDRIQVSELRGANGFVMSRGRASSPAFADVATGGDLNADGIDDLAIIQQDDLLVLFGQTGPWPGRFDFSEATSLPSLHVTGVRAGLVDMGGDANGDGIADLLVGTAIDPDLGINRDPGSAHVLLGAPGLGDRRELNLAENYGLKTIGGGSHHAGMLGDINGDGLDDLAVGSRQDVHVVYGVPQLAGQPTIDVREFELGQGFTWNLNFIVQGIETGGHSDVNGDGIDDLILTYDTRHRVYRSASSQYADGETHVVFGRRPQTVDGSGDIHEILEMSESEAITYTVTGTVPADHQGVLQVGATAHLPADLAVAALEIPDKLMQTQSVEFEFALRNESDVEAIDVAVQSELLVSLSDVHWHVKEGFSPVSEIYKLDSSRAQRIDETTAKDWAAAHQLAWDYDGDGIDDNIERLSRILRDAEIDLVINEHTSQASLGDIDADGFDDLVHVVSNFMLGESGPVSILFGSDSISREDLVGVQFERQHYFLQASPIGDFNGDGINDLAIGDAAYEGIVWVVFGGKDIRSRLRSPLSVDGSNGFALVGTIPRELFSESSIRSGDAVGAGLDSIGDVNQDGVDDLLVTAAGHWSEPDDLFVVYGKNTTKRGSGPIDVLDVSPHAEVIYTVYGNVAEHAESLAVDFHILRTPGQVDPDSRNDAVTGSIVVDAFGDLNSDELVDLADFEILAANFGKVESAETSEGDLNGDHKVDFTDFLLFSHWFSSHQ